MTTRLHPRLDGLTVHDAVSRAADAGQRLINDRIDLARVEAKAVIGYGLTNAALAAVGAALLILGYLAGMVALVLYLAEFLPNPAAVAIVAVPHLLIGAVLLLIARYRQGRPALQDREEILPGPENTPVMYGGTRGTHDYE